MNNLPLLSLVIMPCNTVRESPSGAVGSWSGIPPLLTVSAFGKILLRKVYDPDTIDNVEFRTLLLLSCMWTRVRCPVVRSDGVIQPCPQRQEKEVFLFFFTARVEL